jgi:serine/threonine protein phosphatase PrpC
VRGGDASSKASILARHAGPPDPRALAPDAGLTLRSALLRGRDCNELGVIETIAEGPAAIALSRGGASKVYGYVDPNEDACLFAIGDGGVLLALADGHFGESGSRILIEAIEAELAPVACAAEPPARDAAQWCEWLYAGVRSAATGIGEYAEANQIDPAPTTLSLAILRQGEGSWAWCCIGDSHAFRADDAGAQDLGARADGPRRRYFLGNTEETWHREATALGFEPLGDTRAIVLATDGLSERGIGLEDPATAVHESVVAAAELPAGRRSQWLARELAARANASHRRRRSGDNIATAVWTAQG